ncbi:MAG: phage portal protein [Rhodobiaceae bacterium]|nr:phage portal protein [Rhodobiaceae bacterium]
MIPSRSLWQRLSTRARPAERKASRTAALIAFSSPGQPVWTPRDYHALSREGYEQNPVAFRAVRMIAEAAASIPWLLYDGDMEVSEHALLTLLQMPNPQESGVSLMEACYGHLQVAGNAYLEAVEAGNNVREIYVLRPDRMKIVTGLNGWPDAYEYSVNGRTIRFDDGGVRPVLHLKAFHPTDDHYGLSPMEAAARAIDVHNAASGWNKALLDNAARPSGALVYKGVNGDASLTDGQFQRLKQELVENYAGSANAGRPLLLEGGLEWQQMGLAPRDLDFNEAKNAAAREIALAFGVPPMLLGIPGDNTFSNYKEANVTFWRQTIVPLVTKTCAALNHWLGPRFGEGLRLGFDLDAVSALNTEREQLWARLAGAGFLTHAEKREAVGYAPKRQEQE